MDELTRELRDTQRNVDKLECSKVHLEERINDLNKTNSLLEEGNSELKVIHHTVYIHTYHCHLSLYTYIQKILHFITYMLILWHVYLK